MQNVVIIGGGPAGIVAAHELLKKSKNEYKVTVLEREGALGGIAKTVDFDGNRIDIGSHRFFSKSDRVNAWWTEILPLQSAGAKDDLILGRNVSCDPNGNDPEKVDEVFLSRDRITRIYYRHKFFDYPIKLTLKTLCSMGSELPSVMLSYACCRIFKRKENSLEDFYINRFGQKLYSMFFEGYTEKVWGKHPVELSAEWGRQRVKGVSIFKVLKDAVDSALGIKSNKETSLIDRFFYPKLGAGQMWEVAAKEIEKMGGEIILHADVFKLFHEAGHLRAVTYRDAAGAEHTLAADEVISTMALKDLAEAMEKEAPIDRKAYDIATKLPYRAFITVCVLVKELQLPNESGRANINDLIPDHWLYIQDREALHGRVQIFNNWSPYLMKDLMNTVSIGVEYFCDVSDDIWNRTDEELAELTRKGLVDTGFIKENEPLLGVKALRVEKAYPSYFGSYEEIDILKNHLDSYENLYCVGRNGMHKYNNMDHSMIAAFEAVDNIRTGRKDKHNIWEVNTEQEYHEEK